MNNIRAFTRRSLLPVLTSSSPKRAYSTGETKIWEPFRSIFEQWTEVKGEACWVEVLMPRDPRTRVVTRMNKVPSEKIAYGVKCTRPKPKIRREMWDDFRRRTLNLTVKY